MSMKRFQIVGKGFNAQSQYDVETAMFAVSELASKTDMNNAEEVKYLSLQFRVVARTLANRAEDLSGLVYNKIGSTHSKAEEVNSAIRSEKEEAELAAKAAEPPVTTEPEKVDVPA